MVCHMYGSSYRYLVCNMYAVFKGVLPRVSGGVPQISMMADSLKISSSGKHSTTLQLRREQGT